MPKDALPCLSDIAAFLERRLAVDSGDDIPVLWRAVEDNDVKTVRRIGLGLERRSCEKAEAGKVSLDALFLHRPFLLPPHVLPHLPVLASHKGFDAHLAMGYNRALADALGLLEPLEPLERADKGGAVVGMVGRLREPVSWYTLRAHVAAEFGGIELALPGPFAMITRLAVAGAMTPELVALAAERGAEAYITGQFREVARKAAGQHGIAVLAVGHRRSERWGVARLARELMQQFPGLEAVVLDS